MKSKGTIAGIVLLAAIIGVMGVEIISNRPVRTAPDEATGRVCPAFHFFTRPLSAPLIYYTTATPCTISWSFVIVGAAAILSLLGSRP